MTDPEACSECDARDIVERDLRRDLRVANRKVEQEGLWMDAWQQVVSDIGDLIADVGKRRRGRKFATVLDLHTLLSKQNDA